MFSVRAFPLGLFFEKLHLYTRIPRKAQIYELYHTLSGPGHSGATLHSAEGIASCATPLLTRQMLSTISYCINGLVLIWNDAPITQQCGCNYVQEYDIPILGLYQLSCTCVFSVGTNRCKPALGRQNIAGIEHPRSWQIITTTTKITYLNERREDKDNGHTVLLSNVNFPRMFSLFYAVIEVYMSREIPSCMTVQIIPYQATLTPFTW